MKNIKKTIVVTVAALTVIIISIVVRKDIIEIRKQSRLQTSVEYKKMIEEYIF